MTDNTPTQRLDSLHGSAPARSPRGLFIALIAVGGAVLIAIVVLIAVLLGRDSQPSSALAPSTSTAPSESAEPSPAQSPSTTPSVEPSSAPTTTTAPSTAPAFATFSAPSKEGDCYYSDAPSYTPPTVHVKVKWKAVNAASVWFIQGTDDAADAQFMEVPLAGTQDDFPYPFDFQCSSDKNTYTLTIVGTDGTHKSKSWTVKNTGDKY